MRKALFMLCAALWACAAVAQHSDKDTQEDIQRHRSMAAAHGAAAQCLAAGKGEKACMAELQLACKGLALGKYCGMRHAH
ncbi:hypothetical protein [Hydrogenophaga sp. PBL-H3]|uniref:hypothetical protein n=1 Tax=Hydrogenophaga sp. PBL-H3 TaxID=434010 RepID=UPI001F35E7CD|nr:hypothetical protein [Hydrogenophaga sp. PBL-H3]